MGRRTLTHLVIIQAIGLMVVAWAASARAVEKDRAISAMARFDARSTPHVDIRGTLKCPMPEENTGQACTLQIVNAETGETLRVAGSTTAMRLFQSGQTRVVASGAILGEAFRVIEIRAE